MKSVIYTFFELIGFRNIYLKFLFFIKDKVGTKSVQHDHFLGFYKQFLPEDSIIFDIGANLGSKTRIFAELGKRVIAVEPNPELHSLLLFRFSKTKNVTLVNSGCAATSGVSNFYLGSNHLVSSFSTKFISFKKSIGEDRDWSKVMKVQMTTLDDLINDHGFPQFCKIDVEGFEMEVLEGLNQKIPCLSFEFTLPALHAELVGCTGRLRFLGYTTFNLVLGEAAQFYFTNWVDEAVLMHELGRMSGTATQLYGDIYAR